MRCLAKRRQLSVRREHGGQEERKAEKSLRTRRQKPRNRREDCQKKEKKEEEKVELWEKTKQRKTKGRDLQQIDIYIALTSKDYKPSSY